MQEKRKVGSGRKQTPLYLAVIVALTGATSAVFPSDERTKAWLSAQQREDGWLPLHADDVPAVEAAEPTAPLPGGSPHGGRLASAPERGKSSP